MGGNPVICPRTAPTRCRCLGHGPGFTAALRPGRRNYQGESPGQLRAPSNTSMTPVLVCLPRVRCAQRSKATRYGTAAAR